ncbi:hypothetical protein VN97_g12418 [Penicillium thymicola]|uniref:Uncharacterized protein n=1 Tax=Penicillium thymicola TaxID=293382 RepID=A0AAI9T6D7_PENTH|nr:hypothetical protein VN97_g12418 [Penicillium thymicola]
MWGPIIERPCLGRKLISLDCIISESPQRSHRGQEYITNESAFRSTWFLSIIGLVVEFVVAIDEARVRFTDDALDIFVLDIITTSCNNKKIVGRCNPELKSPSLIGGTGAIKIEDRNNKKVTA